MRRDFALFVFAVSSALASTTLAADGTGKDGYWEEGPEVDVTSHIVSMDEGHEIFMDKRAPEERGAAGFTWETTTHTLTGKIVWEEGEID